jgi:hypothetical protein
MDFDSKASNIFLVIFQMKVIFQQNGIFQHTYVCLNEKLIEMFFCEIAWIMHLINSKILKSPKLIIDNLEVGRLKKNFHLTATKQYNTKY